MIVCCCYCCLFRFSWHPVTKSEPPRPILIQTTKTKTLDVPYFAFFGEVNADADSNLYFHTGVPDYRDSTIVKVQQNESQPIVFSLPSEFVSGTLFDGFQVSSSGEVYAEKCNC